MLTRRRRGCWRWREDVLARARRLVGDDRIDVRIEEHRLQPREHRVERFAAGASANVAPAAPPPSPPRQTPRGVIFSTNLRAVRLLYGPLLIQNSFV